MSRLHSEDRKKVRYYSDLFYTSAVTENRRRSKAINDEARRNSLKQKLFDAKSQCIHPLHKLEKEWKAAIKVKDPNKIEETRFNLLRGLDKAAADYMGRIMAEIKQIYLNKKGLYKDEMLQVNLSVDEFYANFKKFCKRELKGFVVSPQDFDQITSWQLERNISSLEKYGSSFGYDKPVVQFKENFEYLKDFVIKENELSL